MQRERLWFQLWTVMKKEKKMKMKMQWRQIKSEALNQCMYTGQHNTGELSVTLWNCEAVKLEGNSMLNSFWPT